MKALFYPDANFDSLFIPHIYFEIYRKQIYNDVTPGKVMIDLGANIGIVTDFLRNKAETIYSIEPSEEHFSVLSMNKNFNHWDNVKIFNLAISDSNGEAVLYHNNQNHTSHSLVQNNNDGGEVVKTLTIDKFFEDNGIHEVDFLKMDIEGSEEKILSSDGFKKVSPMIKTMLIEFHTNDREKIRKMLKLIRKCGFSNPFWKMRWISFHTKR